MVIMGRYIGEEFILPTSKPERLGRARVMLS
jgi:hypothetical protein